MRVSDTLARYNIFVTLVCIFIVRVVLHSYTIYNQKKMLPNLLPWIVIDFTNDRLPTYL